MTPLTAASTQRELAALASPTDAANLQWFFKTGPGEYGAGDIFRGIRVPALRQLAPRYDALPMRELLRLLRAKFHEDRLFALLLLVRQFERGDEADKRRILNIYLRRTRYINNWDLVDLSAPNIVGAWVAAHGSCGLLEKLVRSPLLWERRIAMVASFALIRQNRHAPTLALARKLLRDPEDLLHKATGWMLREVGKRDKAALCAFLGRHAAAMPRTMLRYAIERFPEDERKRYLRVTGPDTPRHKPVRRPPK